MDIFRHFYFTLIWAQVVKYCCGICQFWSKTSAVVETRLKNIKLSNNFKFQMNKVDLQKHLVCSFPFVCVLIWWVRLKLNLQLKTGVNWSMRSIETNSVFDHCITFRSWIVLILHNRNLLCQLTLTPNY